MEARPPNSSHDRVSHAPEEGDAGSRPASLGPARSSPRRARAESGDVLRDCMHCGRESLTDCCSDCERRVDAVRRDELTSQVEIAVTGPLGTSSTRDSSTWDGGVLRGDDLAAWDDDLTVVDFVNQVADNVEVGKPPAYRYAAAVSGEARSLTAPEYGQWKRRLLLECGVVPRPTVSLAALPGDLCAHAHRLWPLIELLIQVRVLGGTAAHDALPLTRRFLRRWVPMGERPVRAAMEDLEAHEFVMRVGTYPVKGIRPMNLWVVRLLDASGPSDLPPAGFGETRG